MQTLKDLLSNNEPICEEAGDDGYDAEDEDDDNDADGSRDQNPPVKVILPRDCSDSFKKVFADANILTLDHDIE